MGSANRLQRKGVESALPSASPCAGVCATFMIQHTIAK